MINSSRANLSLDLLSFFLQNDSLVFSSTSTFHLCISSVYFTVRRGDLLNLPQFYCARSVSEIRLRFAGYERLEPVKFHTNVTSGPFVSPQAVEKKKTP